MCGFWSAAAGFSLPLTLSGESVQAARLTFFIEETTE
jgi:hypothetical protein